MADMRRRIWSRLKIAAAAAGLAAGPGLATAGEPSETLAWEVRPGDCRIARTPSGESVIALEGFRNSGSPGDPILPMRVFCLLLPPDARPGSVSVAVASVRATTQPGTYDLSPAPPIRRMDGAADLAADGRRPRSSVYREDHPWPERCAGLVSVERMRKWLFARVSFVPVRYRPRSGRLETVEAATLLVSYRRGEGGSSGDLLRDSALDHLAPEIFDNYEQARRWYPPPAPGGKRAAGCDYAIITTNAIRDGSNRLAAFVSHQYRRGHSVRVVTETDWGALVGPAPNHNPEKIRKWLQNNYLGLGLEYVLLVGDPYPDWNAGVQGDVPMKLCWPWVRHPEWGQDAAPTDYYYADLTGDWDLDGDSYYYGEYYDDTQAGGVDITPEVLVGRIPVYNGDYRALDLILDKIIRYESAADISWRRSALLPMSFLAAESDQAALAEQMRNDYLEDRGFSLFRMYQKGSGPCGASSAYACEEELRGGTAVKDRWAAGDYGLVCWAGHGASDLVNVGYDGCWDGVLFQGSDCPTLDDRHPSFTYQDSCQTGHPEYATNLQYALLRAGAAATVAATRDSWGDIDRDTYGKFDGSPTSSGIGYAYLQRLSAGESAGRALGLTKQAMSDAYLQYTWLMNLYDFNLCGDPSGGLFSTGAPPGLTISGDYDGDGTADPAVYRSPGGLWSVRGLTRFYLGGEADCAVPADYGGNGTAEAAVFRPAAGLWSVRGRSRFYFGSSADRPAPGDYRGGGKADAAIFRDSPGLWAVRELTRAFFGAGGDLPVPGDYDGDGTEEFAVFRPSTALWSIRGGSRFYLGSCPDLPVPADYDGDGTSDAAVFRPVGGLWSVPGVSRFSFGNNLDQPVPGDYAGSGTAAPGVFRDSSGLWSVRGRTRIYFGSSGDLPVTR